MSKYEEAALILKLYELRREETMRAARDWYFLQFNPQSMEDINRVMFGEHSGHLRMVVTYWEMAATLVKHDAIAVELFHESNSEHVSVFSKIEPFLEELRAAYGPRYAANLEKLIDTIPDGRAMTARARERMKEIRALVAQAASMQAAS